LCRRDHQAQLNADTGSNAALNPTARGYLIFQTLQPGKYTATVDERLQAAVSRDIVVSIATAAQVTIALGLARRVKQSRVTATQEVLNTSTPSLTNVINTRQVVDLPLAGRNPLSCCIAGWYCGGRK